MGTALRALRARRRGFAVLRSLPALLLLALAATCGPRVVAGDAGPRPFPTSIRGITVSTHTDGRDWGGDGIPPTFEAIAATGANWVAIHPYASVRADGSLRFPEIDPASPPAHLTRPIREAHRQGLKILVKPHLAYWGGPFAWRGEIDFDDPDARNRFFDGYTRFVEQLAAATREADAFVVGTELTRLERHEADWRRIVARVRAATPAPLTYAANWDAFESIRFWDALDAIGVQAYFPLVPAPEDGSLPVPTRVEIDAGWRRWMDRLRRFSEDRRRSIVFTELGYNEAFTAPYRPWEYRSDGPPARPAQERAMASALTAIGREPSIAGVFLWKWFPEPHPVGRNFGLATPAMTDLLRRHWRTDAAGATTSP